VGVWRNGNERRQGRGRNVVEGELPVDAKASHKQVQYERPSVHSGERCGNCANMVPNSVPGRCLTVASPIWSNGWCVRWEGK